MQRRDPDLMNVVMAQVCDANPEQFALLRPSVDRNRKEVSAALTVELAREGLRPSQVMT